MAPSCHLRGALINFRRPFFFAYLKGHYARPSRLEVILLGWKSLAHGGLSIKLLLGPTRTRGPYELEIGFLTGYSRDLLCVTSFYDAFRASAKLDREQRPVAPTTPTPTSPLAPSAARPIIKSSSHLIAHTPARARISPKVRARSPVAHKTHQSKSRSCARDNTQRAEPPDFSFPACRGGGPRHGYLALHSRTPGRSNDSKAI